MGFYKNVGVIKNQKKFERKSTEKMAKLVSLMNQGLGKDKALKMLPGTGLTREVILEFYKQKTREKMLAEKKSLLPDLEEFKSSPRG